LGEEERERQREEMDRQKIDSSILKFVTRASEAP